MFLELHVYVTIDCNGDVNPDIVKNSTRHDFLVNCGVYESKHQSLLKMLFFEKMAKNHFKK